MASCGSFIVGIVLFILNLVWLIISSTLIYLGARMLFWQHEFKSLEELADINVTSVATFLLVLAVMGAFIAILGLCGICCRNSCSLKVFGFLILGLIALEVAAVVMTNKDRALVDKFENATREAIKDLHKNNTKGDLLQQFQYLGHCCGFEGPQDYENETLPVSCCGYNPSSTENVNCPTGDKNHPVAPGCKDNVNKLTALFGSSFALSVTLILFELAVVMAACCLAKEYQLEDAGQSNSVF
ncbi:cd63 antigen [Tyrophagus putrescentiae]|nr:cd63 antigen [Tyrophagus putrescentiae]